MLSPLEFADRIEKKLNDQPSNTEMCVTADRIKSETGRKQLKMAYSKAVSKILRNRKVDSTVLEDGRMRIVKPDKTVISY